MELGELVKGFKFEEGTDDIFYADRMDEYDGVLGEITFIRDSRYQVLFDDGQKWWYPKSLYEEMGAIKLEVGQKICGFKWITDEPDAQTGLAYAPPLDDYIGVEGTVRRIDERTYQVDFGEISWWYPIALFTRGLKSNKLNNQNFFYHGKSIFY